MGGDKRRWKGRLSEEDSSLIFDLVFSSLFIFQTLLAVGNHRDTSCDLHRMEGSLLFSHLQGSQFDLRCSFLLPLPYSHVPLCFLTSVMNQVSITLGPKELNTPIMCSCLQICISQFFFFLNIIFYMFYLKLLTSPQHTESQVYIARTMVKWFCV